MLTELLLDRIKHSAPARIVNVASTAHKGARKGLDFDDLQSTRRYGGMQVYSKSKLANIYFTTELARRLEGTGVTVNCLHPGTVATGYGRDGDSSGVLAFGLKVIKPFILDAEKGARTSVYLASSPDVATVTGQYFVKCKVRKPSAAAPGRAPRPGGCGRPARSSSPTRGEAQPTSPMYASSRWSPTSAGEPRSHQTAVHHHAGLVGDGQGGLGELLHEEDGDARPSATA